MLLTLSSYSLQHVVAGSGCCAVPPASEQWSDFWRPTASSRCPRRGSLNRLSIIDSLNNCPGPCICVGGAARLRISLDSRPWIITGWSHQRVVGIRFVNRQCVPLSVAQCSTAGRLLRLCDCGPHTVAQQPFMML